DAGDRQPREAAVADPRPTVGAARREREGRAPALGLADRVRGRGARGPRRTARRPTEGREPRRGPGPGRALRPAVPRDSRARPGLRRGSPPHRDVRAPHPPDARLPLRRPRPLVRQQVLPQGGRDGRGPPRPAVPCRRVRVREGARPRGAEAAGHGPVHPRRLVVQRVLPRPSARLEGPGGATAAQQEFVVDLARRAVRPTLSALIDRGCRVIQIDEPAAGTHPDEAAIVVDGFNAATEGLDAEFTMHICYSNYADLLPTLLDAKRCRQWAWEFANRDTAGHDGYAVLKVLAEYGDTRDVGLGVADVHRDAVETPEVVADRIRRAAKYLGDPSRIWVNPDC